MAKFFFFFSFPILQVLFIACVSFAQEYPQPNAQLNALPPVKAVKSNKISLDIKGMDVVDVLKMLSTRADINIVIGKNVTGRITVFLKDVDVWDAFEIILLANDLAYEKKDSIVTVMTQRDYELIYGERYQDKKKIEVIQLKYAKAVELSKALNQIKTNIGRIVVDEGSNTLVLIDTPVKTKEMADFIKNTDLPIQTRIFSLNYAQADKISPKIQELLTKTIGTMKIDERTNKIVVSDYPERLDEIAHILTAFDERTQQVLIDAQVIEIKPSDKFEMGVDWDFFISKHFEIKNSLPVGTSNRLLLGTVASTVSKKGDYKAILDILRTIGDTKILSSPRIMALNNQEAKILVGTKDAFITSTTSQSGTGSSVVSQSVNFVDVGIKLYVTPTINRDDFITMKIRPEISSAVRTDLTAEGKVTQVPIVSTSEAETTVMLKDGVTIIIGGLKKDEKSKTVKKIPFIGDIPFLGLLFQNVSDEVKATELVILLTPHIISGETSYSSFSEIKPKEGAVARMADGEIITERFQAQVVEAKIKSQADISFSEYYGIITEKIKASAVVSAGKEEKGRVKIAFTILKEGSLKGEPQILESSGFGLSELAINIVKAASPFPPLPKSFDKTEEVFKIQLLYD